jgi:hypothetical protein
MLHHEAGHCGFVVEAQLLCADAGANAAVTNARPCYRVEEPVVCLVQLRNGAAEQVPQRHAAVLTVIVKEDHDDLAAPASL